MFEDVGIVSVRAALKSSVRFRGHSESFGEVVIPVVSIGTAGVHPVGICRTRGYKGNFTCNDPKTKEMHAEVLQGMQFSKMRVKV